MPLDFPTSPALNQVYSIGGKSWKWNGDAWETYNDNLGVDFVETVNGVTGDVGVVGGTDISVSTAGKTLTINYTGSGGGGGTNVVSSFNGLTGAVQGVSSWNGQTGAVSFNDYVASFNGVTGAVEGVCAAVAGTGISVSGATGTVTITNTGVQSFNGETGAVQGVSRINGRTGAVGLAGGRGISLAVSGATTTVNLNYLNSGTALTAVKYPEKADWVAIQESAPPNNIVRTQLQNISYLFLGTSDTKGSGAHFRMATSINAGAGTAEDRYVSFENISNEIIGIIDGGTYA